MKEFCIFIFIAIFCIVASNAQPPEPPAPEATNTGLSQNVNALTGFAALLIMFTIVFEKCTHTLDGCLSNNPYYLQMLYKLYRELMILGLVSFIFFFLELTPVGESIFHFLEEQSSDLSEKELHEIFEVSHIGLFIVMVFYVIIATALIYLSSIITAFWDKAEVLRGAEIIAKFEEFEKKRANSNPIVFWLTNGMQWYSSRRRYNYHFVRSRFIKQQGLHSSFAFNDYAELCMKHIIIELVDIHWSVWGLALIFLVINWVRYNFIVQVSTVTGSILAASYGWVLFIFFVITFYKTKGILRKLLNKDCKVLDTPPAGVSLVAELALSPQAWAARAAPKKAAANSSQTQTAPGVASNAAITEGEHVVGRPQHGLDRGPVRRTGGKLRYAPKEEKRHIFGKEPNAKAHKALFWLSSPGLLLRLIQASILFMAFYIAVCVYYVWSLSELNVTFVFSLVILIVSITPPVLVLFVYAPLLIPTYSIITSVGGLVQERLLLDCLDEERAAVKHTLPSAFKVEEEAQALLMALGTHHSVALDKSPIPEGYGETGAGTGATSPSSVATSEATSPGTNAQSTELV